MKFIIDTTNKTICIEERINLRELSEALDSMFPNFKWFEFDLIPSVISWIGEPISIPYWPQPNPNPVYPWITYTTLDADPNEISSSDTCTYSLVKGIFNVDLEVPNE